MLSHWLLAQPLVQVGLQLPEPLHPKRPQPPSGSVPAAWFRQVPTKPVTLQDEQVPVHALLQQTPSAQKPEPHCASEVQPVPLDCFATHALPLQYWLDAQALTSAGQSVDVPLQRSTVVSQLPAAARHTVFAGVTALAGQSGPLPGHASARSQAPAAVRHVVAVEANALAGQPGADPVHVSATSHTPAASRQVAPAG